MKDVQVVDDFTDNVPPYVATGGHNAMNATPAAPRCMVTYPLHHTMAAFDKQYVRDWSPA